MKKFIFIATIAVGALFIKSCYYDSEEFLYPGLGSGCDTITVTFTATIKPMLSNNCFGCHSNSTAASFGNNIKLENYADVVAASTQVAGSVNHTGGFAPMPKNGGMLNACLLTQFEVWINRAMPEN